MFEDDSTLALGNVDGDCEGRSCFSLVVTVESQQARAAQTIDLRQIDTDACLVDPGNRAVKMTKRVRRPTGGK